MNLETPQQQYPNVTQIPVQYPGQEFPPQEQPQQFSQGNSDGHQEVTLEEGSEHERAVSDNMGTPTEVSQSETYETGQPTPSESTSETPTDINEVEDTQAQQDVDAGRWDHDKGETLAHVLQSTDEGKATIAKAQGLQEEAARLRNTESPVLTELLAQANEYRKRLDKEGITDYEREDYEEYLRNTEEDIARERKRTEKLAVKQEEYSSQRADIALQTAEQLFDKNPEYAAGLSTEAFMHEVDKFTEIKAYFIEIQKEKTHLDSFFADLDKLDAEKNASYLTSNKNGKLIYETALRQLYSMQDHTGKSQDERAQGVEALVETFYEQIDPYSHSGAEAIKNVRALIEQFAPAYKERAKKAMESVQGAFASIKNGVPITALGSAPAEVQ